MKNETKFYEKTREEKIELREEKDRDNRHLHYNVRTVES